VAVTLQEYSKVSVVLPLLPFGIVPATGRMLLCMSFFWLHHGIRW
jgi:hypothetical protein